MMSVKPIGGYFELELSCVDNFPHRGGTFVNTGRNALELILRGIGNIKTLYVPYYTCDVVLEPIKKLNIQYLFYHINGDLELNNDIELGNDEYILYTNYFGIKDNYVKKLESKYRKNLIVDNAQALYAEPTDKCLYSPRKFVGIPDGGIAFTDDIIETMSYDVDNSFDRCEHLLIRHDKGATEGYSAFKGNSSKLRNQNIKQMSNLTKQFINSVDFDFVKKKRIENFNYLHTHLKNSNRLYIDNYGEYACPMVYPYYTNNNTLKQRLIDEKIFVATYWPNVLEWCNMEDIEYKLASSIIAIPIDQRYGMEDMNRIIKEILL